ncbi:MAG: cellulose binding domain-containing protein [Balneolaceae bacterium]
MNRFRLSIFLFWTLLTLTVSTELYGQSSADVRLEYKNNETSSSTQSIRPQFILHNDGIQDLNFTDITIRYWFTSEPSGMDVFVSDAAAVGKSNVEGSFGTSGDMRYLEVSFTPDATIPGWSPGGGTPNLFPGGSSSLETKIRIHDDGWNNYNQSNDYSWDQSITSYTDYDYITVYHQGSLVWGTPPSGSADAEQMLVTQQPQTGSAGDLFSPTPVVRLVDAQGTPVEGVDVTVSINQNSFSGGSTTIVTSDTQGYATFDNLRVDMAADDYQLTFDADASLVSNLDSDLFDINPNEPTSVTITTQPFTIAAAGETLSPSPAVTLVDNYGNSVPGEEVTVSLNQHDFASGDLTLATNASGVATFSDLVITQAASDYRITFSPTASSVSSVNSSRFQITPANASQLTVVQQPLQSVSGGVITGPPTVRILDNFSNPVSGIDVTVSEAGAYTLDGGTLTRSTNDSGLVVFNNLEIETVDTGYILNFDADASGVSDVQSGPFDVIEASGSMTVDTAPSETVAGEVLTPHPLITLLDGSGSPLSGVDVTVSLNQNGFSSGTLTVETNGSGEALFDDLVIESVADDYEITFNADYSGVSNVLSSPFDVVAAPPAEISVSNQPESTVAGNEIEGPPEVTVTDSFGNPVSGIEITVSPSQGSFSSGTVTITTSSGGIAEFDDLVLATAADDHKLQFDADAPGVDRVESNEFTVSASTADELSISEDPPEEITSGVTVSPAPAVLVSDVFGNPVPGVNVTVSLNKNNFTGGSTVIVESNSSGLAIFDNLQVDPVDTGYEMIFSAQSLSQVVSESFAVLQPDPPFGSIRLQYDNDSANGSAQTIRPHIQVFNDSDVNLNLDELTIRYWFTSEAAGSDNYILDWAEMGESNGSHISGTFGEISGEEYLEISFGPEIVIPIGLGGDGSTPNLLPASATLGLLQTRIHDTSWTDYDQTNDYSWDSQITSITDHPYINVYYKEQLVWGLQPPVVEGAVELEFTQQPGETVSGEVISPGITVHLLDREGELVVGDNDTEVTIQIENDPTESATLSGTTTVTASDGIAVFDDLHIDKIGSSYTLQVAADEFDPVVSASFDIVEGSYYSRQNGPWNDPESWSVSGHSGPAATRAPETEDTVFIGGESRISLTGSLVNNKSVTILDTGRLEMGEYILTGEGDFSLQAGGTLGIGSLEGISYEEETGGIQNEGERTFSEQAHYLYSGSAHQQVGDALPNTLEGDLAIDNEGGVSLDTSIRINGILRLESGVLIVGNGLSLIADEKVIDEGELQYELVIDGQQGYRLLSSPVATTFDNMLDGVITQGFDGASISGAEPLQPNVLWYDETYEGTDNQRWRAPTNIEDSVVPSRGYHVYMFGEVDGDERYDEPFPYTIRVDGLEHEGDGEQVDFQVTYTEEGDTGWNLVGNPYGAAIDWEHSSWTKTNIDPVIYVWDANINQYQTWNGSVGDIEDGVLAPFQGFMVKANDDNPELIVHRDAKTIGGDYIGTLSAVEKAETIPSMTIEAYYNRSYRSTAHIMFSESGLDGIDRHDGYKLQPPPGVSDFMELFSSTPDGDRLAITNLPRRFGRKIEIPLELNAWRGGRPINEDVQIHISRFKNIPEGWTVELLNEHTGEVIPIMETDSITISLNHLEIDEGSSLYSTGSGSLSRSSESHVRFLLSIDPGPDATGIPDRFHLGQNYPNPFRGTTTLRYELPEQSETRIDVFDILGRRVGTLLDKNVEAGHHTLQWDASSLSSGLYLIRMISGDQSFVVKSIVIR